MFGYVTVDKSEMLVKDFETYRGVYCSLCKQLGKDYGIFSKFILSYDCTFYAVVALSVTDSCPIFAQGKCQFNPFKKCNYLSSLSTALSMAAALSVITAYYKVIDNISDSRFIKKILCYVLLPFVSAWRKKAKKLYPDIETAVSNMSRSQLQVEQDKFCLIDKACEPTAKMLSDVMGLLSVDKDTLRIYSNFGYFLGKWIYLMDAVNDIDSDIRHKNFNPLYIKYKDKLSDNIHDINGTLNHCLSEVLFSYNLFEHKHFRPVIENVLLYGLPKKQHQVLYKEK